MNIAILIDAENVEPAHGDQIFTHAAGLGTIVTKEIFGAATALGAWVEPVLKYAMHTNLTIKAAKGKNSSDIALVIGAMDLIVAGGIDTVIIASSDSDFSSLSVRLRTAGINVIGMGTDKANALWRTACTSFVVLQTPRQAQQKAAAAAKPAPRPEPKPAVEAPKPKPAEQKPVSPNHGERVAVISAFIAEQIKANGGRVQVNTLFPLLNALPDYRVDQRGSKKKPLSYLTHQYGDVFHFEGGPDGNDWVSEQKPADKAEEPEKAAPVQPAEEKTAVEETTPVEPVQVETEPASEQPAASAEPEESSQVDPMTLLTNAGLSQEVAGQLVAIFTAAEDKRDAYNRLRKTFGNEQGREYYHLVRDIANAQ